jgi:hypothetical protein
VRQGIGFLRMELPTILATRTDALSPRMLRVIKELAGDACTHSVLRGLVDWSGGGQLGVRGGSEGARASDIAGLWLALRADSMTCGRSGQRHCRFSPLQHGGASRGADQPRWAAAGCNPAGLQTRQLDLKGRTAPTTAYVIGRHSARLAA